jgi:hypothetical protein
MTDTLPTLNGKSAAQVALATRRRADILRMIDDINSRRVDASEIRNALRSWVLSHESASWHLDELHAIKQVADWGWKLSQVMHSVTVDELIARGRGTYSQPCSIRWRERQTDDDTLMAGLASAIFSAESIMSEEPLWAEQRTRREGFAVLFHATKTYLGI